MIYTKKTDKGEVIRSPVTGENTFTTCVECGKEIQVSLLDRSLAKLKDPFNPQMRCPDCTAKMMRSNPPTERQLVYICSPLSGNIKGNQVKARRYCRYAVVHGYIPIAPHLLFPQFMDDDDPEERNLALRMDLTMLSKCDEMWVFGDHISNGMGIEILKAQRDHMTIRYFSEQCKEVG